MFEKLDPEKKERILIAAFEEFAEHPYDKASTNRIVKKAGIGKGMLFYYFNNKKELFENLIDLGCDFIVNEYLNRLDDKQTDFIEKYKQASRIKLELYTKKPHIFNFFGTLYINYETLDLPEALNHKIVEFKKLGTGKIYSNIDSSYFRKDIPEQRIYQLIRWSMEGYEKNLLEKLKRENLSTLDYAPYWDDFYDYLDILKKLYYI